VPPITRDFEGSVTIETLPDPTPPHGGVVIKVEATGLCLSDWHGWKGHDPDITLPHVPGHELAGVVQAIGKGVEHWKHGDRVTLPFVCGCGGCPHACRATSRSATISFSRDSPAGDRLPSMLPSATPTSTWCACLPPWISSPRPAWAAGSSPHLEPLHRPGPGRCRAMGGHFRLRRGRSVGDHDRRRPGCAGGRRGHHR
jgi:hypothetical protein